MSALFAIRTVELLNPRSPECDYCFVVWVSGIPRQWMGKIGLPVYMVLKIRVLGEVQSFSSEEPRRKKERASTAAVIVV